MTDYRIIVADVMDGLAQLEDESCQVCITSPPYWGLRDYSVDGQIGLEPTLDAFIEKMVEVFHEVRRVLRRDGCLFLNLGDSYAGGCGTTQPHRDSSGGIGNKGTRGDQGYSRAGGGITRCNSTLSGLKPKDLCGVPWRVALALQADGWWLRSAMPWIKRSCMPESTRDRPTSAIEYVFMLTRQSRYYWDGEAVRVGSTTGDARRPYISQGAKELDGRPIEQWKSGQPRDNGDFTQRAYRNSDIFYQSIKPPHGLISDASGDPLALDVNPQAFKESHFATFAEKLVEPLILAATSAKGCCPECGAPWRRVVEVTKYEPPVVSVGDRFVDESRGDKTRKISGKEYNEQANRKTIGWEPGCDHDAEPIPCTVLDCFSGAGTTGIVALRHNREYIGIELSEDYAAMSRKRIEKSQRPNSFRDHDARGDAPLFEEMA